MAVIDCFTYNGEMKVAQIHFGVLAPYVDKFIVIEANKTFSGFDKPLYFFRDQRYFKEWWKKIEYCVVNDWDDTDIWTQAIKSPNTKGASHWKREFYVKESIHKALEANKIADTDTVFIGDADEILDPTSRYESETPFKARLQVYSYHLNNASNEEFWGTLVAQYKDIKGKCLNHLRSDKALYSNGSPLGWHFTNMGGVEEVRRKLNDSYTTESYNTYEVQQNLSQRFKESKDYIGRDFKFSLDESMWPPYLKENRGKFKHLCKSYP